MMSLVGGILAVLGSIMAIVIAAGGGFAPVERGGYYDFSPIEYLFKAVGFVGIFLAILGVYIIVHVN